MSKVMSCEVLFKLKHILLQKSAWLKAFLFNLSLPTVNTVTFPVFEYYVALLKQSKMSPIHIYLRMFGYIVTILMHACNTVSMVLVLHRLEAVDLFKNKDIKFFNDMQARYLTCWGFFLQVVYSVVGLVCDYLTLKNSSKPDYRLPKYLASYRNALFPAVVWPLTLMVFSVFWSLYIFDRELVFPVALDQALTTTSNHIIHTAIVPVALWEVAFMPRREPSEHWKNIAHGNLCFVLYIIVVLYTYFTEGAWLYPFFGRLYGTVMFPILLMFLYGLSAFYYYTQWPLTRFFHGNGDMYEKAKIR